MINSTLKGYQNEVKRNINSNAEGLFEIEERKRKRFVENNLFQVDRLSYLIDDIQSRVASSLEKFSGFYKSKSIFKKYKYLDTDCFHVAKQNSYNGIKVNSYSGEIDESKLGCGVGITVAAAMLLGPVGAILGGMASYFGLAKWVAKEFKLPKIKKNFKSQLRKSLSNIEEELLSEISNQLIKIDQRISDIREGSFAKLHSNSDNIPKIKKEFKRVEKLSNVEFEKLTAKKIILGKHYS
ncbi:hypothetical protein [Natroniella sp. ANB-PHB2]|uniref:hypothetical protein n=1 Tax=Natroniella sp. ANB-PHB2 TaxID=3384444 RepID=UPI0038D401A7